MSTQRSTTQALIGLALPLLLASCAGAMHGAKLAPSACRALAADLGAPLGTDDAWEARELSADGLHDLEAGRDEHAAERLVRSYRLAPTKEALGGAARALEGIGCAGESSAAYRLLLERHRGQLDEAQEDVAIARSGVDPYRAIGATYENGMWLCLDAARRAGLGADAVFTSGAPAATGLSIQRQSCGEGLARVALDLDAVARAAIDAQQPDVIALRHKGVIAAVVDLATVPAYVAAKANVASAREAEANERASVAAAEAARVEQAHREALAASCLVAPGELDLAGVAAGSLGKVRVGMSRTALELLTHAGLERPCDDATSIDACADFYAADWSAIPGAGRSSCDPAAMGDDEVAPWPVRARIRQGKVFALDVEIPVTPQTSDLGDRLERAAPAGSRVTRSGATASFKKGTVLVAWQRVEAQGAARAAWKVSLADVTTSEATEREIAKNKGAPADATSSYDCHVACYQAPKDAQRCAPGAPASQTVTSRVRVTGAGLADAARAARDEARKSVCTPCAPSPSALRCAPGRP